MAKVNYRKCDICGDSLRDNEYVPSGFSNGYRIWNRVFNGLDICDRCMSKIKRLSIDIEEEKRCVQEVLDKHEPYENDYCESAYLQGVEDALGVLSHKRLLNLKIRSYGK